MGRHGSEKLSKATIAKINKAGRYCDGRGLWLQVKTWPAGVEDWEWKTLSWYFKYTSPTAGKVRYMGLGQYDAKVGIDPVRERAREARMMVAQGIDPKEHRDAAKRAAAITYANRKTFRFAATTYIEENEPHWENPKHRQQWRNTMLSYAYPVIGDLPLDEIEPAHIEQILRSIWVRIPFTAKRLRGRIETVLDFAVMRKWRNASLKNPAVWKGNLEYAGLSRQPDSEPHKSLDYHDITDFMVKVRAKEGRSARALELLILTCTRTTAVIGATWDEINFDAKVWTIPHDRAGTKISDGKPKRVPLSDQAIRLLRDQEKHQVAGNPHIFVGEKAGRHLSDMSMLKVAKQLSDYDITGHGFRATMVTWCAQKLGIKWETLEAALQHKQKNKLQASYQRGDYLDERAHIIQHWANYCDNGQLPDNENIVQLRASA